MNRNSLIAWILLLGLMFLWTTHKQNQATEEHSKKVALHKADSLAKLAAAPAPATGADSAALAASKARTPVLGEATDSALAASGSSLPGSGGVAASGNPTAAAPADSAPEVRRVVTVETNRFTVRLDNQGARIVGVTLKDLAGSKPKFPEIISGDSGALTLTIDNQDLSRRIWRSDAQNSVVQVASGPVTLRFRTTTPDGRNALIRSYTFNPDSTGIGHRLEGSVNFDSYAIGWNGGLHETEDVIVGKGIGLMSSYYSELIFDNGVNVERLVFEGGKTINAESGILKWAGLRRKYVAGVIDFNRETNNKITAKGKVPAGQESDYPHEFELLITASNVDEKVLDFDFQILPLSYDKLLGYNRNYEKIIFSGWESFFRADVWYVGLCGLVLDMLKYFNGFLHNWGLAIILLTLVVRAVTFPLTIAQTKQGAKMQLHMPAIAKIREKHKGSPQKANLEIMEYYKKEGVNPLSGVMGCFPMFLQMPIFIALFNVLGRSVELREAPFFGWVSDLSRPDVILEAFKIPYVMPLGLTILPFFMAGTMWIQMKMTIKDPNQKFMVWMMPIMMYVFSCSFPSGLVLYWTVSNLFTIGQTYFYTNRLMKAAHTPAVKTEIAASASAKQQRNKPAKT